MVKKMSWKKKVRVEYDQAVDLKKFEIQKLQK